MTPQLDHREQFLAERKKGIGGSDIAAVFNAGYGCALRLWREKRDEVPDFPPQENAAMELGQYLEPYFAAKYEQKTGRSVFVRSGPAVHPEHPELRVNVDRMINDADNPDREVGVLEIKSVGRAMFYKIKREGLSEDYILQLQHGMLCTETDWGSFAIGCRDTGELLDWDVDRNELIGDLIVTEGVAFWEKVQSGEMPERLEPDDHRCQKCEYRKSCQGAALIQVEPEGKIQRDETLRPILTEYLERKALADQADELLNESKEQLKTAIGARTAVEVAGHPIYFRPQTAMRGDFKALADVYEDLRRWALLAISVHPELGPQNHKFTDEYTPAESFKKPSESRPLRIF